jgi:hypothetical protein
MSPERSHALARAIIRAAAALVPAGMRDEWRREWDAELASLADVPLRYRRPSQRALGAFADAFWLRQQSLADFDWIDDVRHGVRQLAQHGSFAVTAIGILALGLAATVTMFSVADQVLLRPLPYPAPHRIVTVWETRAPDREPLEVAPGNLLDWRARAQTFGHLAGAEPWSLDVAGNPRPEVWFSAKVTEGFFEVLGVQPFIESNINIQNVIAIGGRPPTTQGEAPRAYLSVATPGYFGAMRIPLKAGRLLDARDGSDARRVAVISDSLARRYWAPGDDPIGDVLRFRFSRIATEVEVVGVVGSVRHDGLDRGARDELFMPHAQMPFGSMTFVIRTAGDAAALIEPARAAIWDVNPTQTIYRTATLDELVQNTVSPRRFALAVIVGFAVVALLLAIGGVYGVLSAIMTSRLREVGLRVALGAGRGDILRLVLVRGLGLAGVGVALGVAGALGSAQLLRSFLFEITPADPIAVGVSTGLMALAALAASYLPARRASSVDPVALLWAD